MKTNQYIVLDGGTLDLLQRAIGLNTFHIACLLQVSDADGHHDGQCKRRCFSIWWPDSGLEAMFWKSIHKISSLPIFQQYSHVLKIFTSGQQQLQLLLNSVLHGTDLASASFRESKYLCTNNKGQSPKKQYILAAFPIPRILHLINLFSIKFCLERLSKYILKATGWSSDLLGSPSIQFSLSSFTLARGRPR